MKMTALLTVKVKLHCNLLALAMLNFNVLSAMSEVFYEHRQKIYSLFHDLLVAFRNPVIDHYKGSGTSIARF